VFLKSEREDHHDVVIETKEFETDAEALPSQISIEWIKEDEVMEETADTEEDISYNLSMSREYLLGNEIRQEEVIDLRESFNSGYEEKKSSQVDINRKNDSSFRTGFPNDAYDQRNTNDKRDSRLQIRNSSAIEYLTSQHYIDEKADNRAIISDESIQNPTLSSKIRSNNRYGEHYHDSTTRRRQEGIVKSSERNIEADNMHAKLNANPIDHSLRNFHPNTHTNDIQRDRKREERNKDSITINDEPLSHPTNNLDITQWSVTASSFEANKIIDREPSRIETNKIIDREPQVAVDNTTDITSDTNNYLNISLSSIIHDETKAGVEIKGEVATDVSQNSNDDSILLQSLSLSERSLVEINANDSLDSEEVVQNFDLTKYDKALSKPGIEMIPEDEGTKLTAENLKRFTSKASLSRILETLETDYDRRVARYETKILIVLISHAMKAY
jgi:hypothetical protein